MGEDWLRGELFRIVNFEVRQRLFSSLDSLDGYNIDGW